MNDIEICEKIINDGHCSSIRCGNCPLVEGMFECQKDDDTHMIPEEAATEYIKNHNKKKEIKDEV